MSALSIEYFSDVLCVWAYVGQIRVQTLREQHGEQVTVADRFMNIYGDVHRRIAERAGQASNPQAAYAAKMRAVASRFDHTAMHEEAFEKVVPRTSNQAHLVLAAVRVLIREQQLENRFLVGQLAQQFRKAFFEEAQDVSDLTILFQRLESEKVPLAPIETSLKSGQALAELSHDFQEKDRHSVVGSPTYVLDGGRQKLFGNVGYRVIEANVAELLDAETRSGASWC